MLSEIGLLSIQSFILFLLLFYYIILEKNTPYYYFPPAAPLYPLFQALNSQVIMPGGKRLHTNTV